MYEYHPRGGILRLEGNHRSEFVLPICHRFCGISVYELDGLMKGNDYTLLRNMAPFTISMY